MGLRRRGQESGGKNPSIHLSTHPPPSYQYIHLHSHLSISLSLYRSIFYILYTLFKFLSMLLNSAKIFCNVVLNIVFHFIIWLFHSIILFDDVHISIFILKIIFTHIFNFFSCDSIIWNRLTFFLILVLDLLVNFNDNGLR